MLLGGLADKGLRFLNTFLLTWVLGAEGFGAYASIFAILNVGAILAGLGLNNGAVYFGARYRSAREHQALKGTLIAAFVVAGISGALATGALAWVASAGCEGAPGWLAGVGLAGPGCLWQEKPGLDEAALAGAFALVLTTLLNLAAASVRAAKDMRGNALYFQFGLSAAMAGCTTALAAAHWLGWPVDAATFLRGYTAAVAVALALTLRRAWRHYGAILTDRAIRPKLEVGALLRYSLPQSLSGIIYQLNRRADILMLTALAAHTQVGLYQVALALSVFGNVPISATQTMFRPVIAERVYAGEAARLDPMVKAITRWLVILAAPIYLGVFLLPDLILSIFKPEFLAAVPSLLILMGGQVIYLIAAASVPLIPMSGRTDLSMLNSGIALAVNLGLNTWLIPLHGAPGAAVATSAALATLSLLHLVEARILLGTSPFSARAAALMAIAIGGGLAVHFGVEATGLADRAAIGARAGGALVVLLAFAGTIWAAGATAEDEVLLAKVRGKLGRLRR